MFLSRYITKQSRTILSSKSYVWHCVGIPIRGGRILEQSNTIWFRHIKRYCHRFSYQNPFTPDNLLNLGRINISVNAKKPVLGSVHPTKLKLFFYLAYVSLSCDSHRNPNLSVNSSPYDLDFFHEVRELLWIE